MKFEHRFMQVVSHQCIGHLQRIAVHGTGGVDSRLLVTVSAEVLHGILYACFNNAQTHIYRLHKTEPGHLPAATWGLSGCG